MYCINKTLLYYYNVFEKIQIKNDRGAASVRASAAEDWRTGGASEGGEILAAAEDWRTGGRLTTEGGGASETGGASEGGEILAAADA